LCVSDSIRLMRHAGVRAVPVVDGNEVIDIFTFTDALRTCSNP
jgi:CBS domain-containing protein